MAPEDPKQKLADEWISGYLDKLQFEQDYYIFPGSSKVIRDPETKNQTGISIKRPDVRLYSTGVVKLYEMIVEGKDYPVVEYTEEEEAEFERRMEERFPELAERAQDEEPQA
jgi:hypothetical protein